MSYTLDTLWHERKRFLPGMLAIAFSTLLILLQSGLLLGLFSLTSLPIENVEAQIWVGDRGVATVDLGRFIPETWVTRLAAQPEVVRIEPYLIAIVVVDKKKGPSQLCTVIGSRLDQGAIGAIRQLTPELRSWLTEVGSVVVDEAELGLLGFSGRGDTGEIFGHRVRVVGLLKKGEFKSLATPYLLCSLETARQVFNAASQESTVFLLARCRRPEEAARVAQRLRNSYPEMAVYTSQEFAAVTRYNWLTTSKLGIATVCTAILGLGIGLAITVQTLYAAVAAAQREFAVLEALGISRWRIAGAVLAQSFWLGAVGIALSLPTAFGLARLAETLGLRVLLPLDLILSASAMVMGMALLAGLLALRSLRLIEPAALLR